MLLDCHFLGRPPRADAGRARQAVRGPSRPKQPVALLLRHRLGRLWAQNDLWALTFRTVPKFPSPAAVFAPEFTAEAREIQHFAPLHSFSFTRISVAACSCEKGRQRDDGALASRSRSLFGTGTVEGGRLVRAGPRDGCARRREERGLGNRSRRKQGYSQTLQFVPSSQSHLMAKGKERNGNMTLCRRGKSSSRRTNAH